MLLGIGGYQYSTNSALQILNRQIKRRTHSHRFRDNLGEKNMKSADTLTGTSPIQAGGW